MSQKREVETAKELFLDLAALMPEVPTPRETALTTVIASLQFDNDTLRADKIDLEGRLHDCNRTVETLSQHRDRLRLEVSQLEQRVSSQTQAISQLNAEIRQLKSQLGTGSNIPVNHGPDGP
jgi:chromosome segregation ATPase